MRYAFPPVALPFLPIVGSDVVFPVHRVYCIGRNYADHAREMGHDPASEPPFFFQKNPGNLRSDGLFPYPSLSNDVQFEIELAVCLHSGGDNITVSEAAERIFGTRCGILGRPWEIAKAFEDSAPCSAIRPASMVGDLAAGAIWLEQNGSRRQSGDLAQMIWSVPEQIAHLSRLFRLMPGDVILTGTPAGVGRVARGDRIAGHIDRVGDLVVVVV